MRTRFCFLPIKILLFVALDHADLKIAHRAVMQRFAAVADAKGETPDCISFNVAEMRDGTDRKTFG